MICIKTQITKIILVAFLFYSGFVNSQNNNGEEIDLLLQEADTYNKKFQDLNEFKTARKANILAKAAHDDKRKAISCYYIARSLFNLGLQKQSLLYIDYANSDEYLAKDPILNSLFIELKGYIYKSLNLNSQGKAQFNKVFENLKNNNSNEAHEIKARTFANLAQSTSNVDSASAYYQLQAKELKKLPERKYSNAFCEHYSYVGNNFLKRKQSDSALYYFEKSYQLKKKYKDPVLYEQYSAFGDYYIQQGKYEKALEYYLKAEQNAYRYTTLLFHYGYIYHNISFLYNQLGDENKETIYKKLNTESESKFLNEQNANMDYVLKVILKDQQKEYETQKREKYDCIGIGISVLLLTFVLMYLVLRKKLKQKELLISKATNTLQQKEDLIIQKKEETESLQKIVNNAYTEVIELAKNNDPGFYFRFQEVYPTFQHKISEISPGLRNSELLLCAYTFLGFTIKDIADYTSKSINTIRNRKQNLRKKFNISTEQDMAIWIRDLINQNKEN